ncbi:OmpA family protein [Diaphorobacter sp.]|uniref:OmpA family protein n=1 Tax=Diaphorobacter sp. TaxID=1934310 RepID=UPI00258DA251|nr:OmpA family protein [Diaphorobacter sp.]
MASAAQTLEVRRSSQSLAATPTHLQPADAAPLTQLQPHVTHGGLVPRETETRLQAAAGPATLLRAAEVPPQRLEQTRALLVELQAQPTPEQAISIDLPADVLFDFDKAELRADAARSLDKAAELLKSYPQAPIDVVGHTDGKGSDAYNDALSQRRAAAVAAALQSRTGRPIATRGMGKRQPVAPNTTPDGRDDPDGRQRNRRVQIVIGALPVR